VINENDIGGDPPCWAHLFEDGICTAGEPPSPGDSLTVDLAALARASAVSGVAWAHQSEDLNMNLLTFVQGDGVASHINDEVDVLVVAVAGDGIVEIDGVHRSIRTGQAVLIAKGARRSLRAASASFAYLTCHRHPKPLIPAFLPSDTLDHEPTANSR
jgi:quercetin dioxygenase-like cupin family protein